jgi:hypothetical protein
LKRKRTKKKEKMYVVSLGLAAGRKICKKTSGRGEGGIPTGERPPPSEKEFQVSVDGTGFFLFYFFSKKKRKKKAISYFIVLTTQIKLTASPSSFSSMWCRVDILMATNKRIRFFESFSTALPKFRKKTKKTKKNTRRQSPLWSCQRVHQRLSFVVVVVLLYIIIEWRLWFIRHMALRPYDNNNPKLLSSSSTHTGHWTQQQ